MAKAAPRPWTLEEFLAWDDGTDRRYELVRGEVVVMAPPAIDHGTIVANVTATLRPLVKAPCRIVVGAGIQLADRDDTYYQADLAISCTPHGRGEQTLIDPMLIVEVLSPSTAVHDRGCKVDDYCRLPSVREIVLVGSEERRVQVWRREGERWLVETLIGEAALELETVGAAIPLAVIYDGVEV